MLTSHLAEQASISSTRCEAGSENGVEADSEREEEEEEGRRMASKQTRREKKKRVEFIDATLSSPKSGGTNNANALETLLGVPWFSTVSNHNILQLPKEVLPERRQKWIFKNTQTHRSEKLANLCANKLGTDATLNEFGRLGRETGVKEYNSLIRICIERAKDCDHEDVALEKHICKAFLLFNFMKEQGFQLEEETYGPLLMYLIDMGMIEEFHFFHKVIESGNSCSDPRLGYYEMLLWIRVNNEEKIQELCNCTAIDYEGDYFNLIENYLLALCESKRNSEFLQLLETVDITKVSSLDHVMSIFKFLGRLVLESFAEKYLLALKKSDYGAENVSNVIFSYIFGIPNLEVEDIISKFKDLHAKLEIKPSSTSYEKLIAYTCDLYMVDLALDIVDEMSEAGLTPSIDSINSILIASEKYFSYALVQRAYLIICYHNLKPNSETFRRMISLSVKKEDFDGAYAMLCDEKKMNLMLTADMYNAIMDGYFQKEDMASALKVFKQMEKANVKPNCQTFSYLIKNCSNEKDIVKYYEEMTCSGIQVTKQVFMALITAYASCGEFEKAKQVILDKGIPVESLNEIKGSLVAALASNGQKFDALVIYEEIKQAGWRLNPEDAFELLPHLHSEEELSILIQLLEDVNDSPYWMDVCESAIACAVRLKRLSYAVPLLKQLKDKIKPSRFVSEGFLFQVFSEIAEEPTDLQFGLDFLRIMKNELDIALSPECFDFLLSICVKEKNLQIARLIWKEYKTANLPYITFSCLWMYRALLVSGDPWGARKILSKIPKDDPHIRRLIRGDHENWVELEAYWGPSFSFLPRTGLQGVA
ncbi:pentatricopeptide repeat-containing protein At4g04790, mitochondrial-like [Pistacia vera]|uniref:pentatricopeptide repeat-containing protein At4g04790, mitochondrial-like n=1 Tax=Pistacia vera TaxID=55513 RepID=UPI001262D79F|nr:pentatricopeptide repeat-containing protein At4g04790, mitochondrial-like [Pistacia vera]